MLLHFIIFLPVFIIEDFFLYFFTSRKGHTFQCYSLEWMLRPQLSNVVLGIFGSIFATSKVYSLKQLLSGNRPHIVRVNRGRKKINIGLGPLSWVPQPVEIAAILQDCHSKTTSIPPSVPLKTLSSTAPVLSNKQNLLPSVPQSNGGLAFPYLWANNHTSLTISLPYNLSFIPLLEKMSVQRK